MWKEGQESREVRHYHFTSWPDRQVPECASSVVHFWSKVRTTDSKDNVPILIHCSAGIGRSGSFIALDYLVDQASVDGYVNVFQCIQNLRHQRVNMVQTLAQYNFLHEALVEALLCPSNVVHCERFPHVYKKLLELEPKSRKPRLQCEFEKLQYITKFHDSMKQGFYDSNAYMTARKEENKEKNRCDTILPPDMHRPWLTTRVFERNDYINAVFLPSYREDRKYLLTQNPLPDTIVDFWRMVYENNVTSVVSLDTASSQSEVYWATAGETVTYIPFQIHHISENEHEDYIERTMKLLNAEEPKEKPRIVKLFECKFWQGEKKVPSDPGAVLTVIERVLKLQEVTASSSLVVHCLNGAQKSGLFCVIAGTIEQLSEEREVALAQTLKQMRIRRHQIVPFYEQYKFAHDVIIEFLKNFDTFSDIII